MEIKYNQNPLRTNVFLTDVEKEQYRYKILKDIIEEEIISVNVYMSGAIKLDEGYKDLEDYGKKEIKRLSEMFDDDGIDQEVEHQFDWMIKELEQHDHCGDCTCVPTSCGKCHAEHILGIDTIRGLGKHEAASFSSFFRNNPDATAKECLEYLQNKPITATEDWHHHHLERWKNERENAIGWLKNYIVDKLGEEL